MASANSVVPGREVCVVEISRPVVGGALNSVHTNRLEENLVSITGLLVVVGILGSSAFFVVRYLL